MTAIVALFPAACSVQVTDSPARMPLPPTATAELTLVAEARHGNPSAFGQLIAAHKSRVFATAAKYSRNHHELEDLAQDIFIKAWKGLAGFRGDAPFEHWLMRVAVRACFDFLRRNRSRREHEISREALLEAGHLAAEGGSPETAEEETEALLEVRRALALLKPRERHVLTLLELEERSVREVASLTGWSETNVKVRAFRARQALRKCIERLRQSKAR